MGADHVHIPLMVIEDGCLVTVECYRRVETLEVIMPHEPLTFAVGALTFNKRFLLRRNGFEAGHKVIQFCCGRTGPDGAGAVCGATLGAQPVNASASVKPWISLVGCGYGEGQKQRADCRRTRGFGRRANALTPATANTAVET